MAGCAVEPAVDQLGPCGESSNIGLPVQRAGRAILVPVTINSVRLRFLIDTGGAVSAIDRRTVLALGLTHNGLSQITIHDVAGQHLRDTVEIPAFQLGSITLPQNRFVVSDGFAYDGLIGLDILSHYDLDIDLPHARLGLRSLGLCPDKTPLDLADLPDRPSTPMLTLPAIRGIIDGTKASHHAEPFLEVAFKLDGALGLAMFDTGAIANSQVTRKFLTKRNIELGDAAADASADVRGLGDPSPVRLHVFKQLDVGGELFLKPTLLVPADPGSPFDLVLGSDYFAHHRVWLNFASNRVFVWPDRGTTAAP